MASLANKPKPHTVIRAANGKFIIESGSALQDVYVTELGFSDGNMLHDVPMAIESEREQVIRQRFAAGFSSGNIAPEKKIVTVKSPMPGLVKAIFANPGSVVKKSTPVLILEAMKMENSITAPTNGTIVRINVSIGASIEKNATLFEIE